MKDKYFYINNQKIKTSFYHLIIRECGGDVYIAQRVFFKCRGARSVKAMVRFCVRNGEMGTTTPEMDHNKQFMENWIGNTFGEVPVEPVRVVVDRMKEPSGVGDVLEKMLSG